MKLGIDIISDVICPWCFIGKRRFEKALQLLPAEAQPEVQWRPFQLNPDMPVEGVERKLYRTRKFGSLERSQALDAQMIETGAGEGIRFAFDRMLRTPNTFEAHRLIWLAGEQGLQDAVVEGLFQAYFENAQDVGSRDVLVGVADSAGMDTRDFLESARGRQEVLTEESWARRQGVQGVPYFLIDRSEAISGAQSPAVIAAVTQEYLASYIKLPGPPAG